MSGQGQAALPPDIEPRCQLNVRVREPENQSAGFGEEKNMLPLPGFRLRRA